jgi:hypothetical protein
VYILLLDRDADDVCIHSAAEVPLTDVLSYHLFISDFSNYYIDRSVHLLSVYYYGRGHLVRPVAITGASISYHYHSTSSRS